MAARICIRIRCTAGILADVDEVVLSKVGALLESNQCRLCLRSVCLQGKHHQRTLIDTITLT